MATDLERLVVSLEASTVKYERAMQRALGQTNQTARKIEQRFEKTAQTLDQRFASAGNAMSMGLAKAFAGVAALRGAQQLIDTSTRITNQLRVSGLEGEALSDTFNDLANSAKRNGASFEALSTLYSRLSLAQKELGISGSELKSFTEDVAVALRVAGTDAESASGALLQLSQALGGGVVRAEEFNSILDGAPTIIQAAARGIEEAGGSVAKLRQLVNEGAVSSKAFLLGFQVGSADLKRQSQDTTFTIAQGYENLKTSLIQATAQFDAVAGASREAGVILNEVAGIVTAVGNAFSQNKGSIQEFIDVLDGSWSYKFGESVRNNVIDTLHGIRMGPLTDDALHFKEAIAGATSMLDEWRASWGETLPPELAESVDALIAKVVEGGEEALLAQDSLISLGSTSTPFTEALGHLNTLVSELQRVRAEAGATAAAVAAASFTPAVAGVPLQREEQAIVRAARPTKPTSLKDNPVAPAAGGKSGGGGGSSNGYADAIAAQERRLAALQRETELQRGLNPLVNDYGFSLEKLRAQMELENTAKEAGLPLDEKRQQQIEGLATGYANATAEAGRLAEAQNRAKESADALAQAGRQALDTIVDGFLEGKDAGEVLQSVVKDLTRSLITMGLNAIGGGLFGGGGLGGIFGGLFGGRGFASGTANTGGARGQPRGVVHGQEAVIPLPSGGRVPVDIRMPTMPAAGGSSGPVQIILEVQEGSAFTTRILQVSGPASAEIASRTVKGYDSDLGSRSAEKQARFG